MNCFLNIYYDCEGIGMGILGSRNLRKWKNTKLIKIQFKSADSVINTPIIEEIGIHGAIHFQLFAKNGSTLNITVSTDCLRETSPNCTTAVFFITKDELKEFANHTLDLNKLTFPHIYNASTIDTVATLSENMDYVVIYNINNDTRTRADYKLAYFPPLGREGTRIAFVLISCLILTVPYLVCFTALGSSIGVVVVVLLTLCLCCLGPKKEIFDDAVSLCNEGTFQR